MRYSRTLHIAKAAYIDPGDCGSIIAFEIHTGRRGLMGNIDLSDCNRKIQWYFSKETGSKKITEAISLLEEFRIAWLKALKHRKRRKRNG